MSLSDPADMDRCSVAPPNLLHYIGQVEAVVPCGDLGILHQVMIFLRKYFLKLDYVLSVIAFLQQSFNARD